MAVQWVRAECWSVAIELVALGGPFVSAPVRQFRDFFAKRVAAAASLSDFLTIFLSHPDTIVLLIGWQTVAVGPTIGEENGSPTLVC